MDKEYISNVINDIALPDVFDCGQCFRWYQQEDGSYIGTAMGKKVRVRLITDPADEGKKRGRLGIYPCTEEEFEEIWRPYFDLDRDYSAIKAELTATDDVMKKAVSYGEGIRILKQDLWETIVDFIISQNNNIPRIKGCVENLCRLFGEPIEDLPAMELGAAAGAGPAGTEAGAASVDSEVKSVGAAGNGEVRVDSKADSGLAYGNEAAGTGAAAGGAGASGSAMPVAYAIPTPERLASLSVEDLAPVRLGYRAKYLIATARQVMADGLPQDYDGLTGLTGVGPKVANCIALFGLGNYSSFPIDTWVRQVMHQLYGLDENDKKTMAAFAKEKFGKLGGFAQQYLFYYMRETGGK